MIHQTIGKHYERQKKSFNKIVRILFSFAGIYWIVIYLLQWMGMISNYELSDLRSGQTWIYFILLTAWGVEYLRESKRYKSIMNEANSHRIPPDEVTLENIKPFLSSFAIMHPIVRGSKAWTMPIVNIVMLVLSLTLIIKQYAALTIASIQ